MKGGEEEDVQPVNPNSREVLHMQLHERTTKTVTHVAHLLSFELFLQETGEVVGLVLIVAACGVHEDTNDSFERHEDHLE